MGWRMVVGLTAKQRRELERLVARAAEPAQVVRRAQVVLWSADGIAGADIARRLQLSAEAVSRIRRRFLEEASPSFSVGSSELARASPAGFSTVSARRAPSGGARSTSA